MSTPHSHLPIGKLAADRLGRGGSAGVCPDAEVLAAYVDGGLSEVEVAVVDGHLATCAACRSLLAALSPAESGAAAPPRVVPFRPRLDWKWLSAAATLVGAAVLWFALPRPEVLPTPPRVAERAVGDAVGRSASAAAETQASPDAAPEGGTEADRAAARPAPAAPPAEAQVATQPAAEPPAPAPPAERPRDEASRGRRALADARPPAAAEPSPSTPAGSSRTEATAADSRTQALLAERLRQETRAAREKEARARRDRPAEEPSEAKLATAANREAARADAEPAAGATGRATPAPALPVAVSRAVEETAITTAAFAEPEGRLRWRIVGGRVVESSSDGGATWTRRLAHRADMLVAGSAPDLGTTWVVGARGTVFRRAVPGEWEKVTSPTDATLVAVAAQDARRARVTAQDGRRFETNDGGATWTPVPE